MPKSEMKYVGVDGCNGGWIAVALDNESGHEVEVFETFADLVAHFSNACLILVDAAIGLNPNNQYPIRPCDTQARQILSRRGGSSGSVFPPPNRKLATEVANGNVEWSEHLVWVNTRNPVNDRWAQSLNKNTVDIARATHDVDIVIQNRDHTDPPTIREVHPEVCFRLLGAERTIRDPKHTSIGISVRKTFLQQYEPLTNHIFKNARVHHDGAAGDDDILDALVAAVTAKLGCQNPHYQLRKLPGRIPTTCNDAPPNGGEMLYVVSIQ